MNYFAIYSASTDQVWSTTNDQQEGNFPFPGNSHFIDNKKGQN